MDNKRINRKEVNRRYHQKVKQETDTLLLRLPRGNKDQIDQMAAHFGVSRPALFELYLLPLLGVIASQYEVLAIGAHNSECSVPSFLDWLIDAATVDADEIFAVAAHHEVCTQFDALFGASTDTPSSIDAGGT